MKKASTLISMTAIIMAVFSGSSFAQMKNGKQKKLQ